MMDSDNNNINPEDEKLNHEYLCIEQLLIVLAEAINEVVEN